MQNQGRFFCFLQQVIIMTVNVGADMWYYLSCREGLKMRENDKLLYKTMKSLLNERLSDAEAQSLTDEGYVIKNPTRKTAVMIALYKKAAGGDLAAIKELRSIVCGKEGEKHAKGRAVVKIDGVGN